jgi:hypothetical protein
MPQLSSILPAILEGLQKVAGASKTSGNHAKYSSHPEGMAYPLFLGENLSEVLPLAGSSAVKAQQALAKTPTQN